METENDTSDADKTAGSPVLGSSNFKRKFLNNKCSRKKAKLRLSDRFGEESLLSDAISHSTHNSHLERRTDTVKLVGENETLKKNDVPDRRCLSSTNVLLIKEQDKTVRFQTASGKPLSTKGESSEFANELMREFFNRVAVPCREKKYRFLSKGTKGNLQSEVVNCDNLKRFFGFEAQECRCSLDRVEIFQKIIHLISSRTSTTTINLQHSMDMYENVFDLKINENIFSENKKITFTKPETINYPKDNIHAKIDDRTKNSVANSESTERKISYNKAPEMVNNVEMDFPQFATASGKRIVISSDKLSTIHSIFKDITGLPDECGSNSKIPGIITNEVSEKHMKNKKPNYESYSSGKDITDFKEMRINAGDELNKERVLPNQTASGFADAERQGTEKCTKVVTSLFSTASGKTIKLPSTSLSRIDTIFKDIPNFNDVTLNIEDEKQKGSERSTVEITSLFSTASGKTIKLPSASLSGINSIFKDVPNFDDVKPNFEDVKTKGYKTKDTEEIVSLFSTASGKTIKLPPTSLPRIDNIFKDIPTFSDVKTNLKGSTNVNVKDTEKCKEKVTSLFSTASGKSIELPPTSLSGVNNIFKDVPNFSDMQINFEGFTDVKTKGSEKCTKEITSLFSTASGNTIKLPSASLSRIDNIFKDIPNISDVEKNIEGFSPLVKKNAKSISEGLHREINNTNKSIHTPSKKSVIEENNEQETKVDEDSKDYITPQRSLPKKRRLGSSLSKTGKISDVAMNKAKSLFGDLNFDDLKLPSHMKFGSPSLIEGSFTPKQPNLISTPQFASTPIRSFTKNCSFTNDVPHNTNQRFSIQRPNPVNLKDLEEELQRQRRVLEKELELVTRKHEAIRMQIDAESSNERIKLEQKLKINKINLKDVKNLEVKSNRVESTNSSILQINPQNAVLLHFNNNWHEVPTVTTEDGCVLVPNKHGTIGISEIEPAFNSMQGLERNLIPKGWIKNHYRWIVWKLASYERFFPSTLGGCLTVDNVIKQLKYRYIRELYKVERPALRRIYEKDDIPQKRMVLCISNIIKNGDKSELELTDGWYSIRAIVDDPLCYQINNTKLKIGTKLIVSGAELLNCEGCHPLELEESCKVRLKIYFNSTRRAAWFSKLGYQRDPSPLPIKLSGAIWNGGNIGRITVYIMRIYPVIYREKTEATTFWRNQNAEYKKIQEYENECLKRYEDNNNADFVRRNVCSLLQMTVIDVSEAIPKPFKCTIWDATESHQEQLKENKAVTCYNLTLRCNGELSCTKKSYFQVAKHDTVKYEKYRRKYVQISSYQVMLEKAAFGEFDTIGYIVKMHIEEKSQCFWLTNLRNNFLLVKINEGPNNCSLLNKVEEECLVAVCNLTLNASSNGFVSATGGFHTIVTQYPQYDFLRIKMEELGKLKRDEIQNILAENRKIIDNIETGNKVEPTTHLSDSEGNALNFSRATSTDAVMSMINIDEIVSKHTM